MQNIKNFKNQVREAFLEDLETRDLSAFSGFDELQDFVTERLWNIGTELFPEYFPEGKLSNEAALTYLRAIPELLDADWVGSTPRENIGPALRSMTANQLSEGEIGATS